MLELTLLIPENVQERRLIGEVYQQHGRFLLADAGAEVEQDRADTGDITFTGESGEENLKELLREVHGSNARRALHAMAVENLAGGTAPDSDVIRARLGMTVGPGEPNRLGGMLTSVGFALRRLPGFPRPYQERWGDNRQTYVMERGVAETMIRLIAEDGSLSF